MAEAKRDWNVYYDCDGAPWAIFLWGHEHDLRTLRSLACKEEMRKVSIGNGDEFHGNLTIGRFWIRDLGDAAEDPDHSYHFCEASDEGAVAISGAKFQ